MVKSSELNMPKYYFMRLEQSLINEAQKDKMSRLWGRLAAQKMSARFISTTSPFKVQQQRRFSKV